MNGRLHVEIGMDGGKTVSNLKGNMLELIVAALHCVHLFYSAFERAGDGQLFKAIFMTELTQKNSKVWACDADPAEKGE